MENNAIVPVKQSDNAIVSISNQISLTNKLLANIENDKKELANKERWLRIPAHHRVRLIKELKEKTQSHLTDTVTDIDGNVYHTVKIGSQCWMVENLKTSRFRDGSAITEIEDKTSWTNAGQSNKAAWCSYDNNAKNNQTYGKLYNWYAVNDSRILCPSGWHVPSFDEFQLLLDYLGGFGIAGGKMKTQTLWDAPNTGADDSCGFTALPAGTRTKDGFYSSLGAFGYFWCSTEFDNVFAWEHYLTYNTLRCEGMFCNKENGLSVRCIRD